MGLENNIPEGWVESTLNELAFINPRESIRKGDLAKNVPMDCIDSFTRKISRFRIKEFKGGTKFKNKDTLLARITPCLENGKTALVDILDKDEIGFGSTEYIVIRENNDKSYYKFLYYLSISPKFRRNAIKAMTGTSGRQRVQTDVLINKVFRFPLLPEQKAIAKVLTAFDDKIELLQAQNKTLENMAQTIFKEWFGKYQIGHDLPEGWRIEKLGDVLETYLGGTPSKRKNEYWDNGSIPWINSGEVNNFRIIKGTTLITKLGLEKSATKLLPKGTVVIAITGSTLGQYSILEIESCFNQSVVGIVGNNKIKSSFIYFWIANNIHAIIRNATGGAQQHINKENVNSFEMILPSDKLLNKFQSIVEPMMGKISNNEFETQSLRKTRDTILPKLMSGQVRVNNIKQTANA